MSKNLTQLEFPGMDIPDDLIPDALDKALHLHLHGKDMRPLKRKPVNKRKSSRNFNNRTKRVKAANAPMRGGYRF